MPPVHVTCNQHHYIFLYRLLWLGIIINYTTVSDHPRAALKRTNKNSAGNYLLYDMEYRRRCQTNPVDFSLSPSLYLYLFILTFIYHLFYPPLRCLAHLFLFSLSISLYPLSSVFISFIRTELTHLFIFVRLSSIASASPMKSPPCYFASTIFFVTHFLTHLLSHLLIPFS